MRRLTLLLATVATVTVATPLAASDQFDDVPNGHTFHDDIGWLGQSGITRGCNPPANDRFCPDDEVTRGQMAAFLVRALSLPTAPDQGFVDTSGSTFKADIDRLAAAGITKGCNPPANNRFCPDDDVTRGQMAAFLVRALSLPTSPDQGFVDTSGSTFKADIDRLAAAGITRGCNPPANNRFCPNDSVTRGQMAAFLNRALGSGGGGLPGNGLIAFDSTRHGGDLDIFVMNPNGSGVKNLTAGSSGGDWEPAWSPDGSKIVFISSRTGTTELWLMNADGSGHRNLTAGLPQQTYESVTFAPNGRVIFSAHTPATRFAIWSMNVNGTGLQVFEPTDDPTNHRYFDLNVSRDGRVIGFTSNLPGLPGDIFFDATVLAFPDSSVDDPRAGPIHDEATFFGDFSPDGKKTIYAHPTNVNCGNLELCPELDLWVVDSDKGPGGPFTNLTDTSAVWEDAAEYSPDGTKVALIRRPDSNPNSDLYVMNPNGTGLQNLTSHPANDRRPAWQPVR